MCVCVRERGKDSLVVLWIFADESLWKSFVFIQLLHRLHRDGPGKPGSTQTLALTRNLTQHVWRYFHFTSERENECILSNSSSCLKINCTLYTRLIGQTEPPTSEKVHECFSDTNEVRRKAPSEQRSRAFRADGLLANSTMPFPVGRPRSSTITMARSMGPNMEKASSRSSLDTNWGRFFTESEAPCVAKRTRICRPRNIMSSSSALAMSARVFVSWRGGRKKEQNKNKCFA